MYNLSNINIGNKIKEIRLSRGLSLDALGKKICKTKATISKYEKNEISLDVFTLLEICNALDCNISHIFHENSENSNTGSIVNPFKCDKLFVYYITGRTPIVSVIELSLENGKTLVKLYNAVKDVNKYASNYSYVYSGELKHSNTLVYLSLSNHLQNSQLENVNITVNFPWSDNTNTFSAFLSAITPNALPVVKKCIISKQIITNLEDYKNDLVITDTELKSISENNAWILENHNHNHFLLDF